MEDLSDEFNQKSTRSIGRNIPFAITFIGHIVYIRKLVFKKDIHINFFPLKEIWKTYVYETIS